MNDAIDQIAARITLHEFLLEIIFANQYVAQPPDAFELLRKTVVNRLALSSHGEGAPERLAAIRSRATRFAEAFFDKTSSRLAQIARDRGRS